MDLDLDSKERSKEGVNIEITYLSQIDIQLVSDLSEITERSIIEEEEDRYPLSSFPSPLSSPSSSSSSFFFLLFHLLMYIHVYMYKHTHTYINTHTIHILQI